jgi:hypothetical protein
MKKLTLSFHTVYTIYRNVSADKVLSPKQYVCLLNILVYTCLNWEVFCKKANHPEFTNEQLPTYPSNIKQDLLLRTIYCMDATAGLNKDGNVPFLIRGVYKKLILFILNCLLQDKCADFKAKPQDAYFLEKLYFSICSKLNVQKEDLAEDENLIGKLEDLARKTTKLTLKLFTVVGLKTITEVQYYTKYDHFEDEECTNYVFVVTKSKNRQYPVGSFVFGTIRSNGSSVILYKDSECKHMITDK